MIPLPKILTDAKHGEMRDFGLVTARVLDAEGHEGLGYTYTVNAGSGAAAALARELSGLLVGEDADCIEALWQKMWWQMHFVGRGGLASFAIAAIDTALWDMKARKAGLPLWKLLGGHDPKVPAYAGGIDLYLPLNELLDQTRENLESGLRAIKMKVGREDVSEDVKRVAAMRELLGSDTPLMVDANMGWSVDKAIIAARRFAELDVTWLEEPTDPDDFDGYARIQAEGGVPIAAGENLHSLPEFRQLIGRGSATFIEPDVATCGGITPWMKVARLAEAANLRVTSHGVHDLHLHLLAAIPNASFLEIHGFGLERFIRKPLIVNEGLAVAGEDLGHGIELDFKMLSTYRLDH
ncbi:mandelate racemase/muconate lactonizing enzyme family protein [Shinella sp. 838]|uniref:mandelate racemase/muconate lactonizing enzyme family protein n=1 Tax=Shinella sp. 838 TaxID=3038164 RepID=UPI0024151F42|nr:mandelate racemase/muconate lactonizing enzyme family protein [Shinella sp. 838]MDG4674818.1 mandelate racemase/muconate lactonizing enzyme family protein [Shinella sp. 838]